MMNVMKKAWEIARKGQKQFGGKVKEYFAQALKMAWVIVKKGMKIVELIGSEKQVKWASSIREVYMNHINTVKELVESVNTKNKDFSAEYAAIENETSAKFWIDHFQYLTKKSGDKVDMMLDVMYDIENWKENKNIRFCLTLKKASTVKYQAQEAEQA